MCLFSDGLKSTGGEFLHVERELMWVSGEGGCCLGYFLYLRHEIVSCLFMNVSDQITAVSLDPQMFS